MPAPRLYADLAHLWPLLSPPEDCAAEAEIVRQVLIDRLKVRGRKLRVLEFGAGAGHTLVHLRDMVDAVAVDLSEAMLAHCKRANPKVRTIVGDMRTVHVPGAGAKFDAVLIHDAIDYLTTEADVRATFANAARHLRKGGVLVAAPTYVAESFDSGHAAVDRRADRRLDVTYLSYVHDPDPRDTTFELILVYLIRDRGAVRVEEDRHTCGLFPTRMWMACLADAGFDAEPLEHRDDQASPHVLFVGAKR